VRVISTGSLKKVTCKKSLDRLHFYVVHRPVVTGPLFIPDRNSYYGHERIRNFRDLFGSWPERRTRDRGLRVHVS